MKPSTNDDDWTRAPTEPAPPCSSRAPAPPSPAKGVFRCDAQGEPATRWGTLYEATREPPLTAEAEVRGAGGCLAMANQYEAKWVFTELGAARLEIELQGAA